MRMIRDEVNIYKFHEGATAELLMLLTKQMRFKEVASLQMFPLREEAFLLPPLV